MTQSDISAAINIQNYVSVIMITLQNHKLNKDML